jgi:hypothetical protein
MVVTTVKSLNSTPERTWKDNALLAGQFVQIDSLARLSRATLGIMLALFLLYPLLVIPGLILLVLPTEILLADRIYREIKHAEPRVSPPSQADIDLSDVCHVNYEALMDANAKRHSLEGLIR